MDATPQGDAATPRSRREIREAEQGRSGRTARTRRPAGGRARSRGAHAAPAGHTWITRATVLGSLAAATIAGPLTAGAQGDERSPFDLDDPTSSGPSTLALLQSGASTPPTASSIAAVPRERNTVDVASRASADREPLPDCDPSAPVDGGNGQLADHSLCDLWQPGEQLRPDAAVALSALNEAFNARFGRNLCLVDSYRSLSSQYAVKASRGYLAATPGTSMHGWGLAIDLCSKETGSSEVYGWLWDNAPAYGWENPPWAQRGGSGKYEPWHFEFRAGVEEVSYWH
ncbi:D-alanyl-D-alanine carboxypeptidase family protein [Isoptericola sediminis]|uniref:Peptidase M15 n=1 Tax=Isoptericola sediminis TaxID=2733572 RepID=A0A849K9E1_9MICO|nr:peptidase M15 [Isoptericola sediminis]